MLREAGGSEHDERGETPDADGGDGIDHSVSCERSRGNDAQAHEQLDCPVAPVRRVGDRRPAIDRLADQDTTADGTAVPRAL